MKYSTSRYDCNYCTPILLYMGALFINLYIPLTYRYWLLCNQIPLLSFGKAERFRSNVNVTKEISFCHWHLSHPLCIILNLIKVEFRWVAWTTRHAALKRIIFHADCRYITNYHSRRDKRSAEHALTSCGFMRLPHKSSLRNRISTLTCSRGYSCFWFTQDLITRLIIPFANTKSITVS